ncbi:MAG: response regulator, partial [Deltaproteobacteria bacterium]|nr:response regulator [Deltaproteobacteria bacterium]
MSQRRIVLVDSDPDFQRLLTGQLGPYGFEIVIIPDGAEALTKLAQLAPVALFIAVDEPDKAGYALCNKAKKGAAANIPVILVTRTVTADGFANHRKLKVHADEYLDKRTLSAYELIGRMDNLIGLGELMSDADLSIPVEVEDLPLDLADDDMVVDEIDGDAVELDEVGDFNEDANKTSLGAPQMVDALIEAETDAAFDALTFGEEAIAPIQVSPVEPEPIAAPLPGAEPAPLAEPEAESEAELPVEIELPDAPADPAAHEVMPDFAVEPEPEVLPEIAMSEPELVLPEHADGLPEPELEPFALDAVDAAEVAEPESAPAAIALEPSEGVPEAIGAAAEPAPELEGMVPEPIDHFEELDLEPEPPSLPDIVPPPEPIAARSAMRAADATTPPPLAAIEPEPARAEPEFDLGLDEVAARADAEQSGVHDRRTLQRVHVLERDNARLKAELDKAKQDAQKPVSREREFLGLREVINSKDKEILELRDEVGMKDRQILDSREKLRQLQHAKTALEGKNLELEGRLVGDSEKAETAESARKTAEREAAELGQRLARAEAKAKADAEAAAKAIATERATRTELEKRLTDEVAALRTSLDQASRATRTEVAALAASHTEALARAEAEAERLRNEAIAALRKELDASHGAAVAAIATDQQRAQAERDAQAQAERDALIAAHTQALAELTARVERERDAIATRAVAEVNAARTEREQAIARLEAERAAELAALAEQHEHALAEAREGHAAALIANERE